ncbi:glutathione S-transferase N-terminal domain-containing protein [Alkalimarinus alittae]|uniref:Glutathione S-transferase N-terminal domain-containing protein n=1 Tax=Alkalimarinus alittae TaxID=2961619 RepID=A0ABY6N237_9ALTE|nr:glutathione S-transferase N-terminal domain-containing protein [Alkalimarinus alittae]UZE96156.1 glutathione S-transferase N-terminal domain-containing protein [Alkalimarinus alittae]
MLSFARATIASTVSMWRGTGTSHLGKRPQQRLHLYDIEGCPYCKLVREAITELDLDVVIYPCPKGGVRFRNSAVRIGGQEQFPYLIDPNTSISLYESYAIISYLFRYYGNGHIPKRWKRRYTNNMSSMVSSVVRFGAGMYHKPSRSPAMMLELYSFESSPFCKPVRELLCELEIPYVLHNVGRNQLLDYVLPDIRERVFPFYKVKGKNRIGLVNKSGSMRVPYLVDPNTGVDMFESKAICHYILQQYAV